jgi:hypothetical protein
MIGTGSSSSGRTGKRNGVVAATRVRATPWLHFRINFWKGNNNMTETAKAKPLTLIKHFGGSKPRDDDLPPIRDEMAAIDKQLSEARRQNVEDLGIDPLTGCGNFFAADAYQPDEPMVRTGLGWSRENGERMTVESLETLSHILVARVGSDGHKDTLCLLDYDFAPPELREAIEKDDSFLFGDRHRFVLGDARPGDSRWVPLLPAETYLACPQWSVLEPQFYYPKSSYKIREVIELTRRFADAQPGATERKIKREQEKLKVRLEALEAR